MVLKSSKAEDLTDAILRLHVAMSDMRSALAQMPGADWARQTRQFSAAFDEISAGCTIAGQMLNARSPLVAALEMWCTTFGASLCPLGADTYGEGVRAMKAEVRAILTHYNGEKK